MGEKTSISWCHHTFNPWLGCTKVSPACAHCYAERDMDHRYHKVKWGPNGTRVKTSEANWRLPLKWNREAEKTYLDACERYDSAMQPQARYCRRRVFCASLADVFEDWDGAISAHDGSRVLVCDSCGRLHSDGNTSISCKCSRFVERMEWATMNDLRTQLFALIDRTPWLDWLLLTKRPENIRNMWPRCTRCRGNGRIEMLEHCPKCNGKGMSPRRDNVWLGTTVENQEQANARIPALLKCRDLSPILFLSCEPLLEEVRLDRIDAPDVYQHSPHGRLHANALRSDDACYYELDAHLDFVITGGETGPNARATDPIWFRSLRNQCADAEVPFHFKQHGDWIHSTQEMPEDDRPDRCYEHIAVGDGTIFTRVGVKKAGRLLDGREHNDFPRVEVAV